MEIKKITTSVDTSVLFKLEVLTSYYSSCKSVSLICKEYGVAPRSFYHWKKDFETGSKSLPLSEDSHKQLSDMRKKRLEQETFGESPEALKSEIARLGQALEYSELRNAALNEVLKIGREQYGIDLLKKAVAKQ